MKDPQLSIIIPCYNEEKTIADLIAKVTFVKFGFNPEIIVVNDCSKDSTPDILNNLKKKYENLIILNNEHNLGKTQTVVKGIGKSSGQYVVIQDADLEYEPNELAELYQEITRSNVDVIYGDRFGKKNKVIYWQNYIGNKFLSTFSNVFTYLRIKKFIPDMEVCYKMIRGDVARSVAANIVSTSNFGLEPEITARLSKYKKENGDHLKFSIVPISYYPRSIAEGKHMKAFSDGFKALVEIIRFNF
ncbi:glycosyltransferase family 2 protein [Candidatus Dojkabacteria bacterium]|nr:glycosyltransferase family 2 protein [Candidatus Dojkabacteria bacterium]